MSLYNPRHFTEHDETAIRRVLAEYGFAMLVTRTDDDVVVSHVPVLYEADHGDRGRIIGHVAAANPHAQALVSGRTFAVFHGPYGYVSPNWYADPAASVPTWNYVAVHAHGGVETVVDLAGKRDIVDTLSARHEAALPRQWTSAKMDPPLLERMLGAIVGFRLTVERFDAKFKLSQNRSGTDRDGVITGLESRGAPGADELAAWMRAYAAR